MAEIVLRVAIIYAALTVLLRISGRREMAQLRPVDLLTMLLVSETVSPALTGGDESVAGGLLAAATLMALTVVTDMLVFRSRRAERLLEGRAVLLIRDGKVNGEVMRRYRITDEDLHCALRQAGLLTVDQVGRAYVESDGEITVLDRDAVEKASRDRRPAPPQPSPGPA
jgi:uncharacterized membrane protein YcaP (DUF421 family)